MDLEVRQFFKEISNVCFQRGILSYESSYGLDYNDEYGRNRDVFIVSLEHHDGYAPGGYFTIDLKRVGFHADKPLPKRLFSRGVCFIDEDVIVLENYSRGLGYTYIPRIEEVFQGLML